MINYAISLANLAISLVNGLSASLNTGLAAVRVHVNNEVERAKAVLITMIAAVKTAAGHQIAVGIDYVLGVINASVSALWAALNHQYPFIMGTVNTLIGAVKAQINYVQAQIAAEIAKLTAWVSGFVMVQIFSVLQTITQLAGLVTLLRGILDTVTGFLNAANVSKLINLMENVLPFVTTIMSDPFGWVLGIVRDYVWPILQFEIAYALGTTKYDLPPKPNWTSGFGGAGGADTIYIPGRDPDLGWPLTTLYVSGNRFAPGHLGTDYGLAMGQAVYACHDGIVHWDACGSPLYGRCLVVRGEQWMSLYAHLEGFSVSDGQRVRKGQKIATGDSTGNSTGPHLHLELAKNGVYINPETLL